MPDTPAQPKATDGPKAEGGKKDEGGSKGEKSLTDSLHEDDDYGLKSLFDSLHPSGKSKTKWYDKLAIRGYTQVRFTRTADQEPLSADPNLFGDASVNGRAENFSLRRVRLTFYGDVSEYLGVYIQPDFAIATPGSTTGTLFGQLRDAYADWYLDADKVHRLRLGLSKVPFGWENLQSSGNRVPLDRTDPINSAVSPNERDLGVFYYWTPEDKQKLFRDLVDGGLKGSGNYGIFGLGVYNGQGGAQFEQNQNVHTVARVTWPVRLESGQVVEASVQGYTGEYVVQGSAIRPLGRGNAITPAGTGGNAGHRDQRVATTFVYYPQPFGFQSEWNWGEGPGLNDAQTAVETRWLQGGYAMVMCKIDTCDYGIFTPYCRWQYYQGGYRSIANAPYGTHDQWDIGVEWQIRKEMELVAEYSIVDGVNLNAINQAGVTSYRNFDGGVFRLQFQLNY
ncbi:MAG TPA: porin [Urbifossiella sp.]|nr:porin [Urbifossiella sp.]